MKRKLILMAMVMVLLFTVGCSGGEKQETPEEIAYREFMVERTGNLSNFLVDTSNCLAKFDPNSSTWIAEMAEALSGIQWEADKILENKDVPKKFEKADIEMKEAMYHYNNSVSFLITGIDNDSADHIRKATQEMEKAGDRINAGTKLLTQ